MEYPTLLKTVGQVAGIGGIALGVLLLVFREVIRKNVFPNLARVHGYRIIRMIVLCTFLTAALGIVAWTYVTVLARESVTVVDPPATDREKDIAERFWKAAHSEDWKTAYDVFPSVLKAQMAFPNFVKASSYALSQFAGPPRARHFESAVPVSGTLTVSSIATFDQQSTFREIMTFNRLDGRWEPWTFVINPIEWPQGNEYKFVSANASDMIADARRSTEGERETLVAQRYSGRYVGPPGWALIVKGTGMRSGDRTCFLNTEVQGTAARVTLKNVLDGCSLTPGSSIQIVGQITSVDVESVQMGAIRLFR